LVFQGLVLASYFLYRDLGNSKYLHSTLDYISPEEYKKAS